MLDLPRLLEQLSVERPVFHSEADFQFALAWHIQQIHPDAVIRLEYKPAYLHKRGYLDIWVRRGDSIDAIEVKYWKRRLDVEVAGERFDLSNQGAQDLARYDFFSDLERIEALVTANPAATGHVLALTNDASYWRPPVSVRDTIDAAFRVHEGREVIGELPWGPSAGAGTMRGRERILNLSGGFTLGWRDYSKVADGPAGTFRYLLAAVAGGRDREWREPAPLDAVPASFHGRPTISEASRLIGRALEPQGFAMRHFRHDGRTESQSGGDPPPWRSIHPAFGMTRDDA